MLHNQSERPANLGYVLTDLLLEYNDILRLSATQNVNLDLFVLGLQGHCSCFTDNDPHYRTEHLDLQRERNTYHLKPGCRDYEPGLEGWETTDLAFRVREIAICERSAYRMGVISKIEPNKTTWNPEAQ